MNALSIEQMQQNALAAEQLLKSLANGNRLMVLCHLVSGEKSVGELERQLELSQSALSQHLAKLRAQGIVDYRKEGTTAYYRITDPKAMEILSALYDMYCG
ncbi:ArsR/SmtB family transcription factor [Aliidiomarina celeris]|uniref:ArsR/SmtB family transcription factor n=1 Tax=Aliidiomarina celeris TaxID=2249428 RepID=UPI000DE80FAF|nr:metalloregulator ArsR/SmtB family transcription factor [Aliidiomarina celeris]